MPGREWKAAAFYWQSQGENTLQLLVQSKSISYLSLSETVCNKFPPDAVSGVIASTVS